MSVFKSQTQRNALFTQTTLTQQMRKLEEINNAEITLVHLQAEKEMRDKKRLEVLKQIGKQCFNSLSPRFKDDN